MLEEPGQAGVQITEEMVAAGVSRLSKIAGGYLEHQEDLMPWLVEEVLRASYAAASPGCPAERNEGERSSARLGV